MGLHAVRGCVVRDYRAVCVLWDCAWCGALVGGCVVMGAVCTEGLGVVGGLRARAEGRGAVHTIFLLLCLSIPPLLLSWPWG